MTRLFIIAILFLIVVFVLQSIPAQIAMAGSLLSLVLVAIAIVLVVVGAVKLGKAIWRLIVSIESRGD